MSKIMIECSNPNDLKELEAAMEQAAGKCNVTHYKQHLGLVEAGKSKSQRDSARIMAAEAGESPAAVESRIRRGKEQVRQPDAVTQEESTTDKRVKAIGKKAPDLKMAVVAGRLTLDQAETRLKARIKLAAASITGGG